MTFRANAAVFGIAGLVLCSVAGAATAPFTTQYSGDALPESSVPAWEKYFADAQDVGTVNNGVLTVSTTTDNGGGGDLLYRQSPGTAWNPTSAGSTLEIRMKIDTANGSSGGADFGFGDGTKYAIFSFGTSGITEYQGGGSITTTTNDAFHTYRFLMPSASDTITLYIDGTLASTFTATASGANRIDFGDTLRADMGQSQWDYVSWTNDGVVAPTSTPEPAALGVALLGGVGMLRRRRHRSA
ncbi:MAG: MYXO-CTERM sorting domain-containing protein [Tepidisphaeraceae bacterium]